MTKRIVVIDEATIAVGAVVALVVGVIVGVALLILAGSWDGF